MGSNRRRFIKGSLLAGAAVTTPGVLTAGQQVETTGTNKNLNILVLGGTGFIGPHMVREALRRGHSITLFNRGRTNSQLFPDLETIKGDRAGNLEMLADRRWDAVIDNSGYVPRHVQNSARLLSKNTAQYLFISSISAYASFAVPNDEESPVAKIADETVEEITNESYGALKALCENRARTEMGDDRVTVLRPTYICGPGDRTDRFSYWPVRTMRGGEMLWPGSPAHPMQIIDVRDLANFTIDCLEKKIAGTFNTVTPKGAYNWGDFLADSQAVTATEVTPVWVDEKYLEDNKVGDEGELTIWHPVTGIYAAASSISGVRARAAGLKNRPIKETIRGLIDWWKTLPEERTQKLRAGLSAERESEVIAAWKAQQS
jgi:2'-hydroxyisoflavone reductase